MSQSPAKQARLFCEQNMERSITVTLETGQVALFSAQSPDTVGPNEDSAAIIPLRQAGTVLVVADGVGGHVAGAQASALAVQALCDELAIAGTDTDNARDAILTAIENCNDSLLQQGTGSSTTIACVVVESGQARPYHVGDSMILVCGQRGKLKFETVSHSPVGYAVEAGMLSESEAIHHEERHLVSNILGSPQMHLSVGTPIRLDLRDTLLIASDGLFDNVRKEEIIELIRKGSLQRSADRLAGLASRRMLEKSGLSKPDDLTFILFRRAR